LTWEGKAEALALTRLEGPIAPLVVDERFDAGQGRTSYGDERSVRRVIQGDALDVARALAREGLAGQVDLIYLDPPYGSGVDYHMEERLFDGSASNGACAAAYGDRWEEGQASYLDMMLPRLAALRPVLRDTGSIWIQVDWRAGYLVRALCDEIFGRERFLNEIVWRRAPNLGRQARSGQFGRTLDVLVVYGAGPRARLVPPDRLTPITARAAQLDADTGRYFTLAPRGDYTDASVARLEKEGRIYRSSTGRIAVKYWLEQDADGTLCKRQPIDSLWTDVPPLRHASPGERTGYPTQKPRALLDRILAAGSPPGGLVVDLFAGSGTTGAAAEALGRRYILGDASPIAIATARSRLLREGAPSLSLEHAQATTARSPIRIDVRPFGAEVEVELQCSSGSMPVSWALSFSGKNPFRVDWHAERGTGRRPADLCRVARVPRARVIRARAYFVDGTLGETSARLATAKRNEPMGWPCAEDLTRTDFEELA
jgi:DNA modification methylase